MKRNNNAKTLSPGDYYALAKKTWDERTAHTVGRIRFLQAVVVLLLALACGLSYALATKKNYVYTPYVVEINNNEVRFAGFIQSRYLKATDAEIIFYLKRLITGLFTVTSDPVLLKERLADVYNITGPDAQVMATEHIIKSRPVEQAAAGVRVDIRFNIFERLTEKTWRCEWLEETREKGLLKNQTVKSGAFTYSQDYPQTELQAETNPSGIFFTEFFVTERRQ